MRRIWRARRIDDRSAEPRSVGLNGLTGVVDFVLAFVVVREMPDAVRFFHEARAMKTTPVSASESPWTRYGLRDSILSAEQRPPSA